MSLDGTEQISDGGRSFSATLHLMLTEVSKTSPELMGWSDCGKMFFFDPYTDGEAMKNGIAPFFSRKCWLFVFRVIASTSFSLSSDSLRRRKLRIYAKTA